MRAASEKNLGVIKGILEAVPGTRLAFVGDGPQRAELEAHFQGMPVVFMVSGACACASVCGAPQPHSLLAVAVWLGSTAVTERAPLHRVPCCVCVWRGGGRGARAGAHTPA